MPYRLAAAIALLLVVAGPATWLDRAGADEAPAGVWPLWPRPAVIARFEPPTVQWGPGHRGVDLLGAVGQPVRAALAGRVAFVGRIAGRDVVTVEHGETRTTYQPVTPSVRVGEEVAAGERLGWLALGGSHCLPRACLHWGWLRGRTYLDPLLLVGAWVIRLLPWSGAAVEPGPSVGRIHFAGRPAPIEPWHPPLIESSGSRVGLLIGPPESLGGHVGVELRRRQ